MSEPARRPSGPDATAGESAFRVRPGAKALVTGADGVLLVRESHADGTPFWTLPGGGARPGEDLPAALRREVNEELAARCRVGSRVETVWYAHFGRSRTVSAYGVYRCFLLTSPSPVRAEGVQSLRWVEPDAVPDRTLPQVRALVDAVG